MTVGFDLRSALRRVVVLLAALTTPVVTFGPASDAHALEPIGDDSASTSPGDPVRASLVSEAKVEVERAMRILAEFERDESVEVRTYIETIGRAVTWATQEPLHSAEAIAALLNSLREARGRLSDSTTKVRDWRRLALAVEPELEVIRIPARFVRRSTLERTFIEPWSPEERRVWMDGQVD